MSISEGVSVMLKLYETWPDQLLGSYRDALNVKVPRITPQGIVLCGMGGSGVTADYVLALAAAKGFRVPVFVHKSEGLPPWVTRDHLVIAISYSGNTYETLSCAREARSRGALVGSVTSGGKLGQWAKESGLPLALIEPNYYPRTALGMLIGAALGLLKASGVDLVSDNEVRAAADALRSTSAEEGLVIANAIGDRDVYIIAGCGPFEIIAHRWRQELSENAKVIAKTEFYPESAHNDLVAWQVQHKLRKGFVLIEGGGRLCSVITDMLRGVYEGQGDVTVRVTPRGEGLLAQLLQGSLLGGYVSVYLAQLRGVDPRTTEITGKYKHALEEAGLS
ncbi:MAG: SIS domain-containing protein [Acidilobus sp.]|nr:MAG: bifunctional phosphoglucose/phosphomannose isomerase [uncultured Acidilobus sp. MG]